MTDTTFNTHVPARPATIRLIEILDLIRAGARATAEAWAARPRFQTYHEMVAEYGPEGRMPRSTGEYLLFEKLPPVRLPGLN